MDGVTAEYVRSVLDYDPKTGLFFWRLRDGQKRWNSRFAGQPAGATTGTGYIRIRLGKERGGLYAHRLAWLHVHGEWPTDEIDHINGKRDDNRIENLRAASRSENGRNISALSRSRSGRRGVWLDKGSGRWEACIYVDGRRAWCQFFDTAAQADRARRTKLAEFHGEFANHGERVLS